MLPGLWSPATVPAKRKRAEKGQHWPWTACKARKWHKDPEASVEGVLLAKVAQLNIRVNDSNGPSPPERP